MGSKAQSQASSWYIDAQRNARTFLGLRVDAENAADLRGALLHPLKTKVATLDKPCRIMNESAAVVINRKLDRARVVGERDIDGGGAGVMQGVVDCLLGDAEQLIFDRRRRGAISASDLEAQLRRAVRGGLGNGAVHAGGQVVRA